MTQLSHSVNWLGACRSFLGHSCFQGGCHPLDACRVLTGLLLILWRGKPFVESHVSSFFQLLGRSVQKSDTDSFDPVPWIPLVYMAASRLSYDCLVLNSSLVSCCLLV